LNGGQRVTQDQTTINGGITQNLPWGGGGVTFAMNNQRLFTTSTFQTYNPTLTANWSAVYTQPILRGFSIDSTRQQIAVTRINRDISDVQLRSTITNTLSNVRNAYWDYVYSVQAVDVARTSLDLANKLIEDNQARVEVGTMAPIDVVQAQSEAASRRQALVQAQATMRTAEIALKRLVVSGTEDPLWSSAIDPVDRPEFKREPINIDGAVRNALSHRTDLEIAKMNVAQSNINLKFLRNQVLPQTDLVATYGLQGLGGTQLLHGGTGLGGPITGTIPGGFGDALGSLFGRDFPTWNVAVNFSYPLGTSTADAAVARARVQINQSQAQIKQVELQVATEVTNAALQVQSSIESVDAASAARELAQKKLEAEQSKFEVGMSTNFFVVQAQRDLADAQNTELRAVLNYRKSLVDLERLQQTTLQNLNITVVSTGGLNPTAVGSGRPTVTAGGPGS
jgi:outer membrane protein TolC